ncbi:nucleic acid-binding protein [Aaosphaeria arxii CBS 175.79]|uniref:Nucleic acid-binding protein n=1 Tax=Aaosphaeria arxii CBS 175.79 TaxID=1450172 RepID=A0A6A5XHB9_9PLEO|nr:nucleic acid-binding protein [Aaosphaeria arxii CBS 175.79]KAF2012246.1 nucleic acid-binding protein [Aaosphaeria arxii CBS 175.79]
MSSPLATVLRRNVSSSKIGVVVSAGKMSKAVKVRIAEKTWDKHFRKFFPSPKTYLVADPNNSLVEGDVVRIASGYRTSKQIRHIVSAIVAPFGAPVEERTPVLTADQLMEIRMKKRLEKDVRSAQKGRVTSIRRIKEARQAGFEIPDLETAMRNVKLGEADAVKEADEAHKGQAGQIITSKERRRQAREKTKDERRAEEKLKKSKTQEL